MGLPEILISFSKLAATAIERSAKGIVCIVVKDSTVTTFSTKTYNYATEVLETDYTAENYTAIQDAFLGTPNKIIVVRVGAEDDFADAADLVSTVKFNWLVMISAVTADQQAVVTYVKAKNLVNKQRKIKCIVANANTTDDMHVVNLVNTSVKRAADTASINAYAYLARLAGVLAGLPYTRSCTYYELTDLESVVEPSDVNLAINGGGFVIINDYGAVKIARGVNSLATLTTGITADMKKITIVEAMDQIIEDVASSFKNDYIGKYKNKYDNQALFISAVNGYFRQLAKEDVLDDSYENKAEVDIEAQRSTWIDAGTTEAADWDDIKVKNMTYSSWLFLMGNVKILDALEDLDFNITMA